MTISKASTTIQEAKALQSKGGKHYQVITNMLASEATTYNMQKLKEYVDKHDIKQQGG